MKKTLCLILFVCTGIALSGCGNSEPPANAKAPAEQKNAKPAEKKPVSKKSDSEEEWSKKAQKYIEINNTLLNFLKSSRGKTFSAEKTKKGDFKEIRTDSHYFNDSNIKKLKETIALPGALPPEVDAAGRKLLSAIEKYVPSWKQLEAYNKAKKYEDDNGAKGKELLVIYLEGIEALEQTAREVDKHVNVVAKQSHEKALARYKAEGRLLELYTLEALGAAEKLIETFETAEDFKDAAKIEAANAHLAAMETHLETMKTEHAKRKAENPKSLPMIDRYESIQSNLTAFAGNYREARKKPSKFNDVVSKYNDAVNEQNRMQR